MILCDFNFFFFSSLEPSPPSAITQSVKPMSPKWSQRTIYLMWKKVFFIIFCKSSPLYFTSLYFLLWSVCLSRLWLVFHVSDFCVRLVTEISHISSSAVSYCTLLLSTLSWGIAWSTLSNLHYFHALKCREYVFLLVARATVCIWRLWSV